MIYLKNWDNPTSNSRNEIVFADRNHDYGAYVIRKDYNSSILKSFFSSVIVITSIFAAPYIYSFFKAKEVIKPYREVVVELPPLKPAEKTDVEKPKTIVEKLKGGNAGGKSYLATVVKDSADSDTSFVMDNDTSITIGDIDTTARADFGSDIDPSLDSLVLLHAEEMPEFPGNEKALLSYLSNNITYPVGARENNIEGTVYISFIIDKNGWVKSPEVKRSVGGGCSEEALRVVSKMPQWKPGKVNHHPVNVQFVLPIKFRLQ